MNVSDFDYELPPERIAQAPLRPRDGARLLAHERAADRTRHARVRDLVELLRAGDLLVVNDTRVRRARLVGRRASGGAVELLLLEALEDPCWRALVKPAARLAPGESVELEGGALTAVMVERSGPSSGEWRLELRAPGPEPVAECIERVGRMPLPPYVRRPRGDDPRLESDREAYQTVYSRALGAIAAPTAGLHFTEDLLQRLDQLGVERTSVTLHVGQGTFQPVSAADTRQHLMHSERFELSAQAVDAVQRTRERGGRVVAVGTTSVRVLEACVDAAGRLRPATGETDLFLTPGHRFAVVDALLTNFHLPRSTLLMLVSAFAGRERVLRLYAEAIERGYRFYSYGDAMLLT